MGFDWPCLFHTKYFTSEDLVFLDSYLVEIKIFALCSCGAQWFVVQHFKNLDDSFLLRCHLPVSSLSGSRVLDGGQVGTSDPICGFDCPLLSLQMWKMFKQNFPFYFLNWNILYFFVQKTYMLKRLSLVSRSFKIGQSLLLEDEPLHFIWFSAWPSQSAPQRTGGWSLLSLTVRINSWLFVIHSHPS